MQDYGGADSARAVDTYYAEALFGAGDYARAGAEYVRSAYGYPGDTTKAAAVAEQQSAQNAIVAYDSALNANKNDRAVQDSLFSAVNQFADHYPHTEIAKRALIEEGRRASEAGRWDVMVSAFRQYSAQWPSDPYTPTAAKLVGDALYKQGKYGDAQAQWDTAYTIAERAGRHTLADSLKRVQASAASIYADSLVKAGQYQRAAEEVYVAYADENPTNAKAADALRNAIETYMLADSVARRKGNDSASKDARTHAVDLSNRLITQFPQYQYRLQYQTLHADLLAGLGAWGRVDRCAPQADRRQPGVDGSCGRRDPAGDATGLAREEERGGGGVRAVLGRLPARQAGDGRAVQLRRDLSGIRRHADCGEDVRDICAPVSGGPACGAGAVVPDRAVAAGGGTRRRRTPILRPCVPQTRLPTSRPTVRLARARRRFPLAWRNS